MALVYQKYIPCIVYRIKVPSEIRLWVKKVVIIAHNKLAPLGQLKRQLIGAYRIFSRHCVDYILCVGLVVLQKLL